ncbi:hypothetical protein A4G20_09590 [Pasteurellaceae bacterium RH1A]|nr:hypothetical protein A4G20_09590 [Pasteurellaceae bacterium RH1A]
MHGMFILFDSPSLNRSFILVMLAFMLTIILYLKKRNFIHLGFFNLIIAINIFIDTYRTTHLEKFYFSSFLAWIFINSIICLLFFNPKNLKKHKSAYIAILIFTPITITFTNLYVPYITIENYANIQSGPSVLGEAIAITILIFIICPIYLIISFLEIIEKYKKPEFNLFLTASFTCIITIPIISSLYSLLIIQDYHLERVYSKYLSEDKQLNQLNLSKGTFISSLMNGRVVKIEIPDNLPALIWNKSPVQSLQLQIENKHLQKYSDLNNLQSGYLEVKMREHFIINNRICDKDKEIYFEFLTNNQDWSEYNTRLVECNLIPNNSLNFVTTLPEIRNSYNIKLRHHSLLNNKSSYQDLPNTKYGKIKWQWEISPSISKDILSEYGIDTQIEAIYFDFYDRLAALRFYTHTRNDHPNIGTCYYEPYDIRIAFFYGLKIDQQYFIEFPYVEDLKCKYIPISLKRLFTTE